MKYDIKRKDGTVRGVATKVTVTGKGPGNSYDKYTYEPVK